VKERKGALGRATGLAEGVAATVRRMARDREARGHHRILELSGIMVELVDEAAGRRKGAEAE
jgi:hypothetical protein